MSLEAPPLAGKIALVTGASRGIGKAIAQSLSADGASVVGFDVLPSDACITGSVASEPDVLRLFDSIRRDHGKLDIAVNCAGIQFIKPLIETSVHDFESVLSVNLKGSFMIAREAARMMLLQPSGGRIINIASELAYIGRADYSIYCASKGGIVSLTRALAREFAPHILVNAVAPGPTDTDMIGDQQESEIAGVPLGRLAQPKEIADTVAFLAGPKAAYFTGQCISPNGGAAMF